MKKRVIKRGDIYMYNFGKRNGSLQNGKRPVVVIQVDEINDKSTTTMISAITSSIKKRNMNSHIYLGKRFGLKRKSMILLEQSFTINQSELGAYIGSIRDPLIIENLLIGVERTLCDSEMDESKDVKIKCLCEGCLKRWKNKEEFNLRRVDSYNRKKKKCSYCNKMGYDYFIYRK